MKEKIRRLVEASGLSIGGTAGYRQTTAELSAALAEDLGEVTEALRVEVGQFAASMTRLGEASDRTAQALVRWTRVLAFATVGLVLATGALVWATLQMAPAK